MPSIVVASPQMPSLPTSEIGYIEALRDPAHVHPIGDKRRRSIANATSRIVCRSELNFCEIDAVFDEPRPIGPRRARKGVPLMAEDSVTTDEAQIRLILQQW